MRWVREERREGVRREEGGCRKVDADSERDSREQATPPGTCMMDAGEDDSGGAGAGAGAGAGEWFWPCPCACERMEAI